MEQDRQIGKQADRSENLADSGEKIDRNQTDGQQPERQNCERTVGTECQQTDTLADQSQTVWSASSRGFPLTDWQSRSRLFDLRRVPTDRLIKGKGIKENHWLVVCHVRTKNIRVQPSAWWPERWWFQQQEPLSLISFITMTTIVDFLYTGTSVWPMYCMTLLYTFTPDTCTMWPFCTQVRAHLVHVLFDFPVHKYSIPDLCIVCHFWTKLYLAQVLYKLAVHRSAWPMYCTVWPFCIELCMVLVLCDLSVHR
jgi:hypothetical protein